MSCPVNAVTLTATGTANGGRARLKGINYIGTAVVGSIVVRDGGASGTTVLDLATPGVVNSFDIMIPTDGILCETDIHVTLTQVTSATFFYE